MKQNNTFKNIITSVMGFFVNLDRRWCPVVWPILVKMSDFTFTFHFHALEEEMATHSIVLAWRIPGTAGHGGLPSMGSHRVRHD